MSEVAQESAPATDTPTQPKKVERNVALMPDRCQQTQHARETYRITIPTGHTMEDVVKPAYFVHLVNRIRPTDIIEVLNDDLSLDAELLVLAVSRSGISVHVRRNDVIRANASNAELAMLEYEVKNRGPHLKWSIIRRVDGAVVKEKIGTRDQAQRELLELGKVS